MPSALAQTLIVASLKYHLAKKLSYRSKNDSSSQRALGSSGRRVTLEPWTRFLLINGTLASICLNVGEFSCN